MKHLGKKTAAGAATLLTVFTLNANEANEKNIDLEVLNTQGVEITIPAPAAEQTDATFTGFNDAVEGKAETDPPNKGVQINDQLKGQGATKATEVAAAVSTKNVMVAAVLSEDPKFLKMVENTMNTHIADGRKRVLIIHGDPVSGGTSKVDVWANGTRGASFAFFGDKLDDTGLKLYKSTKEVYKEKIKTTPVVAANIPR